ncbi:hypothetical protein QCB44_02745 [Thiomicrorhabdus sp. zzn3]|uniref:hypothetical protein n=1 Tax=Thiomicrorhabdus sp. zzn3 TaxID=3039775 RepID=UPI002436C46D|nr:hypothetical protein [Thiomicrorhabdus sp. zzn3]MDG6777617.1 hypothetical protein [Thiomicrorhabdus sp. zzn3]
MSSCRKRIKLLITARDPATAVSFQILIPQLIKHHGFEIKVLAQAPASDMLMAVYPQLDEFFPQSSLELKQQKVKAVIDAFKPDAVLCGISGPDIGVDEATLKVAQDQGIESYALQSFWGDINQLSGAVPKHAFVLDDEAVRLTEQRYPQIRSIAIGSIKHADFKGYDVLKLRDQKRTGLLKKDEILVSFYGQPILEVEGYFTTLEAMVRQLTKWSRPFKLMYRPHPKESQELFDKTWQLFSDAFSERLLLDQSADIVESLCMSDLVVSVFSTCGFDNLYLNEMSAQPFNSSVYLWFDPNMIEWWQRYSGLTEMPLISEGLLLSADTEDEILTVFDEGLNPDVQKRLWIKAKQHLPDPSLAVKTIIDTLLDDLDAAI